MAAPHGLVGQVGDIDGKQVHRNAAGHRAALAAYHDIGAARAVVAAAGPEIAVGISGRDDRQPGRPPGGPGRAVADTVAALDVADLHDARLQVDNRLHRIVGLRRRIDTVRRCPRAHHIEHELRPKKNAGGIG